MYFTIALIIIHSSHERGTWLKRYNLYQQRLSSSFFGRRECQCSAVANAKADDRKMRIKYCSVSTGNISGGGGTRERAQREGARQKERQRGKECVIFVKISTSRFLHAIFRISFRCNLPVIFVCKQTPRSSKIHNNTRRRSELFFSLARNPQSWWSATLGLSNDERTMQRPRNDPFQHTAAASTAPGNQHSLPRRHKTKWVVLLRYNRTKVFATHKL